ncbi:GNAT family N-acetyltransferase [Solitalea sp. MAHUQ-68]|uniref:GNAT family N-acetyltransferase n=1 Tax=Solitalea agri TaxID=2953739 RepID=A0A9X2JC57_9SPHI|nr:GNAT family N-acetyltransferase [Solitalea agri]MCO4293182.1 GNAT family N-acetyltransferase [Solitalea agri]
MLKVFTDNDFDQLKSWITDAEILFQFAGSEFTFPISKDQLIKYSVKNPDRKFYMGYLDNGVAYAFGEIIPQENNSYRLGRLLVGNPNERGKGLGSRFVNELVDECKHCYNASGIDLYVWEGNKAAIKCYQKVGFAFTNDAPFSIFFNRKEFVINKMTLNSLINNQLS